MSFDIGGAGGAAVLDTAVGTDEGADEAAVPGTAVGRFIAEKTFCSSFNDSVVALLDRADVRFDGLPDKVNSSQATRFDSEESEFCPRISIGLSANAEKGFERLGGGGAKFSTPKTAPNMHLFSFCEV